MASPSFKEELGTFEFEEGPPPSAEELLPPPLPPPELRLCEAVDARFPEGFPESLGLGVLEVFELSAALLPDVPDPDESEKGVGVVLAVGLIPVLCESKEAAWAVEVALLPKLAAMFEVAMGPGHWSG